MRVFATPLDVRGLLMTGSGYADLVVVTVALATVPAFSSAVRSRYAALFDRVARIAPTYELYLVLTLLLATPLPRYFRDFVVAELLVLPARAPRGDGVLTLVEFVLGLRENTDVSVDKFDHVARVLLARPQTVPAHEYFAAVCGQCHALLVNINRPTIGMCVAHFLEQLWARSPRIVEDFFLRSVWAGLAPPPQAAGASSADAAVLVCERDLNNTVNVLLALSLRGLPHDLLLATFGPVLVPLWGYYCFLRRHAKSAAVAQNILVAFLTQAGADEQLACAQLLAICDNLVAEHPWTFRVGPNQLVEICAVDSAPLSREGPEQKVLLFVSALDGRCEAFLDLVEQLDDRAITRVFVALLAKWARGLLTDTSLDENPFARLVLLRLLENLGTKFKDRLAQTPLDILLLVQNVLGHAHRPSLLPPCPGADPQSDPDSDDDSDDDDDDDQSLSLEIATVVLELLLAILAETQPAEFSEECRQLLASIHEKLMQHYSSLKTAQSVAARIALILDEQPAPDSAWEAEKRVFARAIASLNDPLVPIRAHGLYLLRQLVESGSPVISADFVVTLHLVQLKDPDPFIYLNAIKGLDSLLGAAGSQVLPVLLNVYCGSGKGGTGVSSPPGSGEEKATGSGKTAASDCALNTDTEIETELETDISQSRDSSENGLVQRFNASLASTTGAGDDSIGPSPKRKTIPISESKNAAASSPEKTTQAEFMGPGTEAPGGPSSRVGGRTNTLAPTKETVESENKPEAMAPADLDERLRVGEVLLRYIQAQDEAFSGSAARLVCEAALRLIRRPQNDSEKEDDRLRMSAMSILGTCCNTNILGIVENIENALDCALGVLDLETAKDQAIMRRSAIVLIHDLVSGTSQSENVPFPRSYMDKVMSVLRYVRSHDLDLLVQEQAMAVLDYIDELVKIALASEE